MGRGWELRVLTDQLAAAQHGRGRGLVLLGEAGIGKTTLAKAFAEGAGGFRVGWGRCPETEVAPYWPWRQALRGMDPDVLLPPAASTDRVSMFGDVAERLARVGARQPTLLILEDVHVADGPSLALLQFLAGVLPELRCMLLLTSRDNSVDLLPAAAAALRALPPAFGRLTLTGLDRTETADLVARILGRSDEQLAGTVYDRTDGNPFFVQELALLHAAKGVAGLGPPAGVGQVVGRRLARLPQRTNDCLSVAAVLGDDVDLSALAAVVQLDVSDVLDALTDAVDARLAVLDGTRVRFAHALVRDVLYDELGARQRAALHAHAGRTLIGSCCNLGLHVPEYGLPLAPCCSPARVEENAGQVADHFRRAIGQPDAAEPARRYALIAARTALRRGGYEQAVRFFRWAQDGVGEIEPGVQLGLGQAQVLAGEMTAGRNVLRRLARDRIAASDGETAARAVLAMGGGPGGFEVDLADAEQTTLLDSALALLPEGDSVIKAGVLARVALGQAHGRMDSAPPALAREAIEMARRIGDAHAEAAAIAAWCDTASGPDFVRERIREAQRMRALSEADGDLTLALHARRLLVVALLEQGDFRAADEQIAAYATIADQLHAPFYSWPVPIWRGMRALMRGDYTLTDAYLAEAAELASAAGSSNAEMMVATLQLGKADRTGTMPRWISLIDEVFAPFWDVPMAQSYGAYFLLRAGERERALQFIERRAAEGVASIPKDAEWLTSVALLGEAGRLAGHRGIVADCFGALRPYDELWLYDGIGAACYGPLADYLGRFAEFLGQESASGPPRGLQHLGELHKTGTGWELRWRGTSATVADAKGIRDLVALLAQPRTPIHVLDLVGTMRPGVGGDTGPVLDQQARAAYKQRLTELAEDLAEAEQFADIGRVERLRAEHDFIAHELSAALGLGGRARVAGDPVERARKAVSMRIAAAIKSVGQVHPMLGRHLRSSVRTGRQCVYEPEDDVTWQV